MSVEAKDRLRHVLWLGGPSEAGKTTVTQILLQRPLRWQWYPCDLHEYNHLIARADPQRHPTIYRNLGRSLDEQWVHTTPEELFADVLATNDERFPMIVDDLLKMPSHPPILVEGPRLFPALIAPMLTHPTQAIWLLPTADFVHASQQRRDKPTTRFRSSDPERFRLNFLEREWLLREHICGEVKCRGLSWIEVDGSLTPETIADQVQAHFESYLSRAF
jgi:hypothetical protein